MAYTTINKPTIYFNTVLYTGNGSTQSITGVGFQPDWTWIKERNNAISHRIFDSVRGATKRMFFNNTDAESTQSNSLTSFDSDGFSLGDSGSVNGSSDTYVAWNWKGGGSASSNSDGSITSSVSANTTAGFSIVTWTGSGASATIGHGLSAAPELVIVKNRSDSSTDWRIGNTVISGKTMADDNGYYLEFDTGAIANPGGKTIWGSGPSAPTSTVFSVGSNNSNNGSSDNMLAYCFNSVKGYSKIGSYIGNGNTNGTFIYTGFKPALIIIKNTTSGSHNWLMFDNKRDIDNPVSELLMPNQNSAEQTMGTSNPLFDFCSNGFKLRGTGTDGNESGTAHLYMAFAESPFVTSTGIPNNAR